MFFAQVAPVVSDSTVLFVVGGVPITPPVLSFLALVFSNLVALLIAWLQRQGRLQEAAIGTAIIKGVEAGVEKVRKGETTAEGVKAAIQDIASKAGVEEALAQRVTALFPK